MPKSLLVNPDDTRRASKLTLAPIPINAYATPVAGARETLGDEALRLVLRDMVIIREFESMLHGLKREGGWGERLAYKHLGPAHLSIGQEAAAVGQAMALEVDDHIFGSHRSHGEAIAKGLSAIARLDDESLERLMATFVQGRLLRLLEQHLQASDVTARALQFLLYGFLAEIFGRRTGFNLGLGGSMHAFFPPFGIYPNNAIVGASAPIAVGAALHKRLGRQSGITVANIGDGATGCGPVWEAINFAGMRQLHGLWEEGYRGGLPVLFFIMNNFYAMGGQTLGETMSYDHLVRVAAAFGESNLHAEIVDGNNPLAVADAVRRKRPLLVTGEGPVLLDVQCYRQAGHSSSDVNAYRTSEEIEAWQAVDPLHQFEAQLRQLGCISADHLVGLQESVRQLLGEVGRLAADEGLSPRLELSGRPGPLEALMFSNELEELDVSVSADLSLPLDRSSRLKSIARRERVGLTSDGERLSSAKAVTIRDALFEAIVERFAHDPELVGYGEENRDWEGAFGVYRGLTELLPYRRLFNAPISEAAIIGSAVGYAMEGGRALVELMYCDFIGRAGDELFNQLAKWQAMSGGLLRMRVVVRVSVGRTYGAQHSQEWTSLVAHIPGLKVVYPVTPFDAKGLMASALATTDPVVFFESQAMYDMVEIFRSDGVPRDHYRIPIGAPDVKRVGSDLTILTVGPPLYPALDAATRLERQFGVSAEVIDARSLVPLDHAMVVESVRKTHRILLVSDAVEQGSHLMDTAARIQEEAFDDLDAPVAVLGARNAIAPAAELEHRYFVQPEDMIKAIHERILRLPGYKLAGVPGPDA